MVFSRSLLTIWALTILSWRWEAMACVWICCSSWGKGQSVRVRVGVGLRVWERRRAMRTRCSCSSEAIVVHAPRWMRGGQAGLVAAASEGTRAGARLEKQGRQRGAPLPCSGAAPLLA